MTLQPKKNTNEAPYHIYSKWKWVKKAHGMLVASFAVLVIVVFFLFICLSFGPYVRWAHSFFNVSDFAAVAKLRKSHVRAKVFPIHDKKINEEVYIWRKRSLINGALGFYRSWVEIVWRVVHTCEDQLSALEGCCGKRRSHELNATHMAKLRRPIWALLI